MSIFPLSNCNIFKDIFLFVIVFFSYCEKEQHKSEKHGNSQIPIQIKMPMGMRGKKSVFKIYIIKAYKSLFYLRGMKLIYFQVGLIIKKNVTVRTKLLKMFRCVFEHLCILHWCRLAPESHGNWPGSVQKSIPLHFWKLWLTNSNACLLLLLRLCCSSLRTGFGSGVLGRPPPRWQTYEM